MASTTESDPFKTKNRVVKANKLATWLIANGDDARTVANLDDIEWAQAAEEAGIQMPSLSTQLITIALVSFYFQGAERVKQELLSAVTA